MYLLLRACLSVNHIAKSKTKKATTTPREIQLRLRKITPTEIPRKTDKRYGQARGRKSESISNTNGIVFHVVVKHWLAT